MLSLYVELDKTQVAAVGQGDSRSIAEKANL